MKRQLIKTDNLAKLHKLAAAMIVDQIRPALKEKQEFLLAISGGSTPRGLFELLSSDYADDFPAGRTRIFWCDERCVPYADDRSNFGTARRLWLDKVDYPAENLHPVPTEFDPTMAAENYERELRRRLPEKNSSFDLCLLGMGTDGHTASIFPGSPALSHGGRFALSVSPPAGVEPALKRVTLTPEALCRSRRLMVMIAGAKKARLADSVMACDPASARLPVALLSAREEMIWLVATSDS